MARPYAKLPPGAKSHLEAMAANGLLSESAAATALGMPLHEFRRVIKEHEPSRDVWDNALSIERDQLFKNLYAKSADGDVRATQALLAMRHGLTEKTAEQNPTDRVNITFQLPAALSPEQYSKLIQVTDKPEQLTNDETERR